ncbi:MAG: GTPase HflX [Ectothiorhodospiraceae bacterium]|nr:GTPase HflX [Chromatiales bacterium]MCP5157116.1 GTPase HflX [Ectothiorhodospiraceae bacterium]
MFERPEGGQRALLVHVDRASAPDPRGLDELAELARSAGLDPVSRVTTTRAAPDPALYVGSGKADEIKALVASEAIDMVVFDHALSPGQERNLERRLECRVLDRITLILDIFAQRASTFEGKLQVELAQLRHLATRLVRGWTHLERQRGGIGMRGPGEKQLETDRRLIAGRIRQIEERLDAVRRRRGLSRRARSRASLPVVSLVGYTNAGKSTLFNRLTGAAVMAEDRLFATLDPTLRKLELPGTAPMVVADTVGFIRDLPHELVAAFRATLEETASASLLIHVVDAADPDRDQKVEEVEAVLAEIGADAVPRLEVLNKIDALPSGECEPRVERDAEGVPTRVWVSARSGAGVDLLLEAVASRLGGAMVRRVLCLPARAGKLRARLYREGTVLSAATADDGSTIVEVALRPDVLERLEREEALSAFTVPTDDPKACVA